MILWAVERPDTPVGRFLNLRPVAHVGVISYSLYLWHPLFTYTHAWWSLPGSLVAAELSYWCVERPVLRLRDRYVRPHPPLAPPPP